MIMRLFFAFFFLAATVHAQTIVCAAKMKDCPRKREIELAVRSLPSLPEWTVVSVPSEAAWRNICQKKCEIPAFTLLESRRTYLFTEQIFAKSGPAGLRAYLAHELAHILLSFESAVDKKASELLAANIGSVRYPDSLSHATIVRASCS